MPAPSPPLSVEHYSSRRFDDPALLAFLHQAGVLATAQTPAQWGFDQLYWTAVYYNPSLAEARAQVEITLAAEQTANQRPNPTLTLIPTYDNSVTPSESLLGLGIGVPIETNGKRDLRVQIAQAQIRASEWQAVNMAWDIRNALLNSLADRKSAIQTAAQLQTMVHTQGALVGEYDERTAQGQIPTPLASQAQVNYQQSRLLLEQTKTLRSQAEVAIANAIGVPTSALGTITLTDDAMIAPATLPTRQQAVTQHPLMQMAMANYEAAQLALQLEVAKQVPDLNIGPGYEWNSQGGGKWSLAVTLTLPVFNNNEGPIAEALARRNAAARHAETVQAGIINAMERAQADLESARRERKAAQSITRLQQGKLARLQSMVRNTQTAEMPLLYSQGEVQNAVLLSVNAGAKVTKAEAAMQDAARVPSVHSISSPHAFSAGSP